MSALPSRLKSPVERFRELLAMSPFERRLALTNRPIETQRRALANRWQSLQGTLETSVGARERENAERDVAPAPVLVDAK